MSAVLSSCGRYRYRLDRHVSMASGPVYAFFGINPSTADDVKDDATVRKWRGFVTAWGGSRFIVGNVFAYRATDVKELAYVGNPVGPDNQDHMGIICAEADVLVPCWGSRNKLPPHLRRHIPGVLAFLYRFNKPVMAFGTTASGDPAHPLMLGYKTPLVRFRDATRPTEGGQHAAD